MKMDRVICGVRSLLLVTVALQVVALIVAAPPGDLITSLPGQPLVDFKQYAGYINVDQGQGKELFYYFVEATNSSATKPLVLWLNGGPGCSSLGGAFTELGPFNTDPSGGLVPNNGSWNQVANFIFLESPVGVGFSYTNNSAFRPDDKTTAADSVAFLLGWLNEFPEYNSSDFYVTGESYGGHYVPQLAAAILANNKVSGQPQIQLKGIMVGNPLFDSDKVSSFYDYAYGHGMISEAAYKLVVKECYQSGVNFTEACGVAEEAANAQGGFSGGHLNPYDVIVDICSNGQIVAAAKPGPLKMGQAEFTLDPCLASELTTYLNLNEVQSALHADSHGLLWSNCRNVSYNSTDRHIKIAPILIDLLNANLRVWVYSGDADIVIPFIGTQRIITGIADTLKLNTTSTYQQWFQGSQVGGWSVSWGSLVYATVRSAGHMVPRNTPERSLVLFSSFLAGDPSPPVTPT